MSDKRIQDVQSVKPTLDTKVPASNGSGTAVTVKLSDVASLIQREYIGTDSYEATMLNRSATIPNLPMENGAPAVGVHFYVKFANRNARSNINLRIAGKDGITTAHLPIYYGRKPIAAGQIESGSTYEFVYDAQNNRFNMLFACNKDVYLSEEFNLDSILSESYTAAQLAELYKEIDSLNTDNVASTMHIICQQQYVILQVTDYDETKKIYTLGCIVGSLYYQFSLSSSGKLDITYKGEEIINKVYNAQ